MKVKYVGPNIGVMGPQDGEIYEVTEVDTFAGALRVVTRSAEDDWNYNDEPDWLRGYLYHPKKPRSISGEYQGGRFEIVEDDSDGSLKKAIYG